MTNDAHPAIRVTRSFTASAERVFDAWLDVKKAARFLFATSQGTMIKAELDARVGGRFLFVDRRAEGDASHYGTYLEIDRPRRLVFTFSVEGYDVDLSTVAIDIVARAGGCELTLTHHGVPAEYAERTSAGWTQILVNLEEAA